MNRTAVAFVGIVAAMFVAFWIQNRNDLDTAYQNQLKGCQRGNVLRHETQVRGEVLRDLATVAAEARQASADEDTNPTQKIIDQAAAAHYRALAARVHDVPVIDCSIAIKHP